MGECVMKPKKVLFVAHSANLSGGANRSLLSVMLGLRALGTVEPHVLMPAESGELEDACREANIPVYHAPYRTCCTVYKKEPKDIVRFLKLLLAPMHSRLVARRYAASLPHDFDLIYTNERIVVIGAYLAKRMKLPHIWHIRTFAEENDTRYSPFYFARMDRGAQKIVLISQALYDSFAKRIDKRKLTLIHNGIDIAAYSAVDAVPHDGVNLLVTGRLVATKGQIEAVQAVEHLLRTTDRPLHLYLAGDTPPYDSGDYKRELLDYIQAHGLQDRVHLLGDVDDMMALRGRMDMELVCSHCEPFGRVTVEAMCAGLPVIGSNSGGTMDILEHQKSGLLYEPHNVEHLAECISRYLDRPEETASIAVSGQHRAQTLFNIETTVRRISDTILQEIHS